MTVTIAAVHTALVSLPAHPDLVVRGAKGTHDRSDFCVVRVVGSNGVEGYGEVSATPLWSGEDGTSARHFIQTVLAPALVNQPLTPVAGLEQAMDQVLAGNPFTKAGVAIAVWDAYARTLGVPLAQALGGPLRTEIPIKLSLSGDGERLERVHAAATKAGFAAFKVKVGLGVPGDLARVAHARGLVGPDTFLGVDANGGWSRADARAAVRGLAPYDIAFVEQPVAADDLEGMAALRAEGCPVVADESVFGMADLRRVIRSDAADVVSVYVGKAGGPGRAVELGRVAEAFGLQALIGSNGELGLGAAAQVHVAAALPGLTTVFPSDIIGAHYYADDILAEPLDSDGRNVRLPSGPGLGVRLRDDVLALLR
ncbi:mandelate racemase/muconate lactonizing enzyme family protein [Actinopolymorpha alba]|uniref:mandelate racemase/muconate lactonizing enzyme family protein n=1 Tax=Actinopolymorpha alba TaxID=533267 RepID=UPI00037CD543|nr:enolase C-terminal domain-like protein [Actinopolymorpha alba]